MVFQRTGTQQQKRIKNMRVFDSMDKGDETGSSSDSDTPLIMRSLPVREKRRNTTRDVDMSVKRIKKSPSSEEDTHQSNKSWLQAYLFSKRGGAAESITLDKQPNKSSRNPFRHTVNVLVGSEHVEYKIHSSILQEKSSMFKELLKGDWSTRQVPILLNNMDKNSFRGFVDWLYSGSVRMRGRDISEQFAELVGLYSLGERLGAPVFLRDIKMCMAELWQNQEAKNKVFATITNVIYNKTGKKSPVRELWVTLNVATEVDRSQNVDFLVDIITRQRTLLQSKLFGQRSEDLQGKFEVEGQSDLIINERKSDSKVCPELKEEKKDELKEFAVTPRACLDEKKPVIKKDSEYHGLLKKFRAHS